MDIKLSELIAPAFRPIHKHIKHHDYVHYWLKGGRGSTKSSFISIEIILGIMRDSDANAVVLRKVKGTHRESTLEQLEWAIEKLGVQEFWEKKVSPAGLEYKPTKQRIFFRGADKPKRIKGVKTATGYIKYIWYEELDEFHGMEEIRTINQTFMRGGEKFICLYSYNPPKRKNNWVNVESLASKKDKIVHESTYLDVPREWLGKQFIIEAEHLKKTKPDKYDHEYLGLATGTGGEIFSNVISRTITDTEIKTFDTIRQGLDWGYSIDPFCYGVMHYDKKHKRLYIFYEIYKVGLGNLEASNKVKASGWNRVPNSTIIADSSEPKSISEVRGYGLRIKGAKKGPGSVSYGIKFLQELESIIIDPDRCPNAYKEFSSYELEKDRYGEFKSNYPDKDNHFIDCTRYALEDDSKSNKWGW